MATETYNVVGDRLRVDEMLRTFSVVVRDKFTPCGGNTNHKDINVAVDDEIADDLLEWCETNGLECELV
jgi:hypothetical protein